MRMGWREEGKAKRRESCGAGMKKRKAKDEDDDWVVP
jgi:hypothetical protein